MSEFIGNGEIGLSEEKKMILDKLVEFLEDWEDEIPEEVVKSGDKKIKCRTRWFTNVVNYTKAAKDFGYLDSDSGLCHEVEQFSLAHTLRNSEFQDRGLTTPEQIEGGNALLRKVIKALRQESEAEYRRAAG